MKPISQPPHDPLDDLFAAALHGELTAAQRAELDALLQHDSAARAAYQETKTMHDLLENNHRDLKPDPNFEDRMISGVKRKVRQEAQRETPWESALVLWRGLRTFWGQHSWKSYAGALAIVLILAGVSFDGMKRKQMPAMFGLLRENFLPTQVKQIEDISNSAQAIQPTAQTQVYNGGTTVTAGGLVSTTTSPQGTAHGPTDVLAPSPTAAPAPMPDASSSVAAAAPASPSPQNAPASEDQDMMVQSLKPRQAQMEEDAKEKNELQQGFAAKTRDIRDVIRKQGDAYTETAKKDVTLSGYVDTSGIFQFAGAGEHGPSGSAPVPTSTSAAAPSATHNQSSAWDANWTAGSTSATAATATPAPTRKLVRDATLDLEVRAYQPTVDTITELAKADGGYLDSSSSERGGNGKLQGTVVAKVAPDQLDAFLLKLRALGTLKNQSVSTEDVTKDYYDTQARLENSRRMETQLQELLKHNTSKVADLLQVERELGRVRGEIEQMQGQLKLYDFQVQYATVTISVAEKDLNKAAAYLLQEHDQFALFVHDVEATFAQAKGAAETYKAQILNADLEHNSDNTMSATLAFSVPPEQVDAFLAKVKGFGRVDNFTRTTNRVANDGGESDEPADETRTDKDRAQVQLTILADDESPRQQTQLAIASTGDIDTQTQQLKEAAAATGATITASSFERETDGTETAALTFRLALGKVNDFLPGLEKLGRVESLAVHRDDQPGEATADASAPAEISLRLHNVAAVNFENEPARQETQLAIRSSGNVDAQAQQLKSDAGKNGASVTGSTFSHSPDGSEEAALTFRLPLAQAADFTATLEKLGKVESLAIQRNDVTGPNSTDPNAPAEISLTLQSEPAVVAENRGFWPTMRHLFGGGVSAFFQSVATIGVLAAFLAPWLAVGAVFALVARRIWVAYRFRKTAA